MTDYYHAPDPSRITKGAGISFVDQADMEAGLQTIRNGKDGDDWIILAYIPKSHDTLCKLAQGSGGADGMRAHLKDDIYAYGLVRVVDMFEGIPTTRFALVIWIGENLSGILKARIAATRASAYTFIGHHNIAITTSDISEVTSANIQDQVSENSGSKSKVVSRQQAENMQQAGSLASGAKPKANEFVPKDRPAFSFQDEASIKDALADVRSDATPTDWALLGYANVDTVKLVGKGVGGRSELVSHLDASGIFYGILRVSDQVDATTQFRFVFVDFLGGSVKPMLRGKITTHKGRIEKFLDPYHVTIRADTPDDVTDDAIRERLAELKGGNN